MPPLLVAVATPKKKTNPLERPGLAPPPFGGGDKGSSYTARGGAPPANKLAAAAALAGALSSRGKEPSAPEADPYGGDSLDSADTGDAVDAGDSADTASPFGAEKEAVAGSGGAMFTQEQSGYCDAQTRCQTCEYMIKPNACTYVKGYIDDDGCCPLHSSRGEASEALETPAEGASDELG